MKIIYIKLVNFNSVHAAMGLNEFELDFSKITKPIIQIYGKNKCGKTVLIQQLHPFSSLNLNGDERNDLNLILQGEVGIKNIVYEINGEVYEIKHVYKPSANGHSISCSLIHNNEELNVSGGVNTFNTLINDIFGINKYTVQFIINGTNLESFASKTKIQRKNLLNKAMGIDIYDKINKLATDDYRYSSKMLSSLMNTKEFLLKQYGSYENLTNMLNIKRADHSELVHNMDIYKSKLDSLSGKISVINQQNVLVELTEVTHNIETYNSLSVEIGEFDDDSYNILVDKQISLNSNMSELKSNRLLILKDIDILYDSRHNIDDKIASINKSLSDHNEMLNMKESLISKINNIDIAEHVTSSSDYLRNMISLAQVINSTCKEISVCLNKKHISMFANMIERNIDISAFLIKEGSVLMDSEKEISVISRIRNMMNTVDGEFVDECCHDNCIYMKTKKVLDTYFKSYQSMTESQFTTYDIEQFDHAYKNIQTIRRLINISLTDEICNMFDINNIMMNLCNNEMGININRLTYLMEQAALIEMKNKYISQLSDIEKILSIQNNNENMSVNDMKKQLQDIDDKITVLRKSLSDIDSKINICNNEIIENDNMRLKFSSIKNINIKELKSQYKKLDKLNMTLNQSLVEQQELSIQYNTMSSQLSILVNELNNLENAYRQYQTNMNDIMAYQSSDSTYKIIAEATSSTKGKPVILIKDKVESTLILANRLLDVMYDGEMEFLQPIIDEDSFDIPFRNNANTSPDIRYGSQSETSLLSFALSLSFAASLTDYNIPLVDEIDAYLDGHMSDKFVLMLQEIMSTLKMEQLFIISHKITPSQYEHVVYEINLNQIS